MEIQRDHEGRYAPWRLLPDLVKLILFRDSKGVLLFMAWRLWIALCLFVLFVVGARARSAPAQASQNAAPPPAAYPDSPKGLQDFLEDLFAAIKANNKPKIDSLWQSTQLPEHAAWFSRVFGDKDGAALEATYSRQLPSAASGPGKTYSFVASLDTAKVVALPLAQAAVNRPDSWAKLIFLSMKGPVSAYRAEAIGPGAAASYMLGYFFYVGSGFRMVDESVFSALSAAKISTRLPYISGLEAQMLLLQSVPPVTPPLVRKDGISNAVMLDVIIDVLGQVRSASILSGDLVLGNAARAAVLGWRYRPYIQNGRPAEVETTVTVTFPL
jgi:TonB family protein